MPWAPSIKPKGFWQAGMVAVAGERGVTKVAMTGGVEAEFVGF